MIFFIQTIFIFTKICNLCYSKSELDGNLVRGCRKPYNLRCKYMCAYIKCRNSDNKIPVFALYLDSP